MKKEVQTAWMTKGTKCWVYDAQNSVYVRARIADNKGRPVFAGVTCELQDKSRVDAKPNQIQRRNDSDAIVTNLVDLEYINDAEILYQLGERFRLRNIFTFIGSNLLVINPYELIPQNYDNKMIDTYHQGIFRKRISFKDVHTGQIQVEPHIYGLVGEVFKQIGESQLDQAIVISGESGSGKTETNKYCLKYLTHVCGIATAGKKNLMEQKIMSCNPLLQAFGNAKTVKNDNSSRFGKLTTLRINKRTLQINSASIRSYFLEKSRIPFQNVGEQNFHIFYYFVKGLPTDQSAKFHMRNARGQLLTVDSFQCIRRKQSLSPTASDQDAFNEVRHAFNLLKFTHEQQESIWSIIAAILHLSNVQFDHSKYEPTKVPGQIVDKDALKIGCKLLGLDVSRLEQSLLFRSRTILNEKTLNPEPPETCRSTKDSLIKTLYENLFHWIIRTLNLTLREQQQESRDEHVSLRLLDIYGFQVFETNGFEQLCVNYTNERLHQLYIEQVFKQEKKIFEEEGLGNALVNINFSDNRRIIEMLDTDSNSVFNLLDEACVVTNDNNGLLNNIRKHLVEKNNEVFPEINKRMTRKAFIIKHTPGEIEYSIEGFRERNIDEVREDLILQLANSELTLIRQMFQLHKEKLGRGKESKSRFLGRKIREEIGELVNELQIGTDVHFIRCIKPNEEKKAFTFVPKMALTQIRYLGLLDTILLRKATYHVRVPYEKFYEAYSIIQFPKDNQSRYNEMTTEDKRQASRVLFRKYFPDTAIERLFGITRIFMKQGSKPIVDKIFSDRMNKIMRNRETILRYAKGKIQSGKAEVQIGRYKMGLRMYRYMKNFVYIVQKQESLQTIKDFFTYDVKILLKRLREKRIMTLQQYFRRAYQVSNIDRRKRSTKTLEIYIHGLSDNIWTNKFVDVQSLFKTQLIDMMWQRNRKMKISTIELYINGLKTRAANVQILQKAEEKTLKMLSVKYQKILNNYLKGVAAWIKCTNKLKAILYIQSDFRMRRVMRSYREIRSKAIRIQRAWRDYYVNKMENIRMVEELFGQSQTRRQYAGMIASDVLNRHQSDGSSKNRRHLNQTVESLLRDCEQTRTSKITLFYYLLDFQPLIDISEVYQENSWIDNYYGLFRENFLKNNPIQYVEVGEAHTLASSCNKLYSWGWNDYEQLGIDNIRVPNTTLNTISLPQGCRLKSFYAHDNYSSVTFEDPPSTQFFGMIPEDVLTIKQRIYRNLRGKYALNSGNLVEFNIRGLLPLNIPDKVTQVACGMAHVICKTSLRKILTWGDGTEGQLGHEDYMSHHQPKIVSYFANEKHEIVQISAAAKCSMVVYSNHRMFWFGSNWTIRRVNSPVEIQLQQKSDYLWDNTKYTPIRIIGSWSKSLSIIGVTFAWHNGVLPTNISLKKKVLQQLSIKWNEQNINTVLPPYIRSITHYFSEKCMRLPIFKPNIQMQSRRKLKEFRNNIIHQLKSLKYIEHEQQPEGDLPNEFADL